MKVKKLIIIGDSAFAEIAYEYFTHDSPYEVVAFCVEKDYLEKAELFGLPIIAFETIETHFAPEEHYFFAALVYTQLNRLRTRLYQQTKEKGYTPASYISSRVFIWRNVEIGEHCFIFEDNVIQPFVTIGNNVVLWSGNHIGHHSTIKDNNFISSHVVISGFVDINSNCFFGVNSTIGNNVTIGEDCIIGAGAMLVKDLPANSYLKGTYGSVSESQTARQVFKIE